MITSSTRLSWLAALLAMLLLPLAASCDRNNSGSTGGDKKLRVGFSQVGAESSWRTAETKSIQDEAAKRGVDLKFSDAQGNQQNQIAALRSFVAQRVDAIILAPQKTDGWEDILKEVKAAKIPVVLVDRGVSADPSLYATLIASDFVEEGRMAGKWLAEKTGGKANIAELQGTPGSDPANDRKKGFEEAIAKHPGMKIIMSQTGHFEGGKGKEVMQAFLKSPQGKEITDVYAHNDEMALGAVQAIEEAGLKPGKDIMVISIDGGKRALQAIIDGKINCAVECLPLLGPHAFDAVEKAVKGQPLDKRTVIKDRLFDSSNAAAAIQDTQHN
jgi:simple sugar transport system substrate-binding protein